ncbi:MAG: acyl-CoA dehydrogenase, partial [Alphaproteobacteria bacterium]
SIGARNDLICQSVEEKLGIHASPTCVMSFGENGPGATGWMLGPPNKGLACMFTMMNNARLHMGLQSTGISERAYQHALAYAGERKQGKASSYQVDGMAPIIHHPDVRRNLLAMKTLTQAMRAISYRNAAEIDRAHKGGSEAARELADLLTPISKAWCSDYAVEVASIGVQIHGGMGFIEETGAAQYYRDARIIPIYEGTNGIQAMDLVGRKLAMGKGAVVARWLDEAAATANSLSENDDPKLVAAGKALADAIGVARTASNWLLERAAQSQEDVLAGATSYLRLMGHVSAAYLLGEQALMCDPATPHGKSKRVVLDFFIEQFLPEVQGLGRKVESGASTLMALSEDEFSA